MCRQRERDPRPRTPGQKKNTTKVETWKHRHDWQSWLLSWQRRRTTNARLSRFSVTSDLFVGTAGHEGDVLEDSCHNQVSCSVDETCQFNNQSKTYQDPQGLACGEKEHKHMYEHRFKECWDIYHEHLHTRLFVDRVFSICYFNDNCY